MTYVTCRLTAENRDQLRNPTLGSRVWTTFTFYVGLSQGRSRGEVSARSVHTLALASLVASASAAIARCNCTGSLTSFLHHTRTHETQLKTLHKVKLDAAQSLSVAHPLIPPAAC